MLHFSLDHTPSTTPTARHLLSCPPRTVYPTSGLLSEHHAKQSAKQNRHVVVALPKPAPQSLRAALHPVSTITVLDAGTGRRRGCSEHSDPTADNPTRPKSHASNTHFHMYSNCHMSSNCSVKECLNAPPKCCRTGAAPQPLLHPRRPERNKPLSFYLRHVCPSPPLSPSLLFKSAGPAESPLELGLRG